MEINNLADRIGSLSPAKRALLEMKLKQINVAASARQSIPPREPSAPALLSFAQERLWFLDQLEPESRAYNQPRLVRLKGALETDALHKAIDTIVARHQVLRTTFRTIDEHLVQVIGECRPVDLPTIDISNLIGEEQEAKIQEIASECIERRFDLSRDLMLRGTLIKLGPAEHILLLVTHHVASDGWSSGILWRELVALYGAFSKGQPNPLPELAIQYADYAVWQRHWLQGEVLDRHLSYWKNQLSDLHVTELLADRPRPAIQSYRGAKCSHQFSRTLTDQLEAISRKEGVTLFMTLLAAFQVLLYRYTGQYDIAVGSPIAGRSRPEIEGLIGFFVNMLVFRSDLSENPTFQQLLSRVRNTALGAYEHQDVPFEKLVEVLHPDRDLSRSPLFQVMFAFQNVPRQGLALPGLIVSPVEGQNETAKYDLSLYMWDEPQGLVARLEYNTDLYDGASIRRLLGHFETLLNAIVGDPQKRISHLPILTDKERQQLVEWNGTDRNYSWEQCVHQLFEARVQRHPDRVALVCDFRQLTYGQLNGRANQMAHYLRKLGVGKETPVGICMERSWEMVVAVLSVLKAGGAYVPLDPSYPRERLAFVMEDAGISVLLTQKSLVNEVAEVGARVVCFDSAWQAIAGESEDNPPILAETDSLAYMIYTSGSTGRPKGVQITHRAVVNFLKSMCEHPGLTEQDILLAVTTLSFDIAGLELFLPLSVGAQVVLAGSEVATDGPRLLALLKICRATVMQATPATWRLLLEAGWSVGGRLKILCGGEAMSRDLADQLVSRGSSVWNMYGPTETTIWSAIQRVDRNGAAVPVGRPIINTQIYILDSFLNAVPIGVPGELCIGGVGLARGYTNRPELVAQQFIPNPFSKDPGTRLYRTGDLARHLIDGNIEFLGRIDHQVKIRGFRIELGEIEMVLGRHPAVKQVIVVDKEIAGDKRLFAYLVLKGEAAPKVAELKEFLRNTVPEYMVPSAFVFLQDLPLTPNGKLDRKALPDPKDMGAISEGAEDYVRPRTPMEQFMAEVWQEVLGVERVSAHDNFFDLGGHSLLSLKVITRIEERTGLRIHPREMILQTLGQIASVCEQKASELQETSADRPLRRWFNVVTSLLKR